MDCTQILLMNTLLFVFGSYHKMPVIYLQAQYLKRALLHFLDLLYTSNSMLRRYAYVERTKEERF
jgi:hypothetical protein